MYSLSSTTYDDLETPLYHITTILCEQQLLKENSYIAVIEPTFSFKDAICFSFD